MTAGLTWPPSSRASRSSISSIKLMAISKVSVASKNKTNASKNDYWLKQIETIDKQLRSVIQKMRKRAR